MSGLNSLLEMAKRSIHTQQMALNVTGHNIANASRSDYSRQEVSLKASVPINYPEGALGTGVEVDVISRARDQFIDSELRGEYSLQGNYSYQESILQKVEAIFNEPSDFGLNEIMSQFWESWQTLANSPENSASRASVIQRGSQMASQFNTLDSKLKGFQANMNLDLKLKVDEINNLATQIANLNYEIASSSADIDSSMNDLVDQRDKFIDDLSKIVNIQYSENPNHTVTVLLDGNALVEYSNSNELDAEAGFKDGRTSYTLKWKSTNRTVDLESGELKGLIEVRDNLIGDYIDRLDNLAVSMVEKINAVHKTGYGLDGSTNISFFDQNVTGADDITVSDAILNDYNKIAAGSTSATGDNTNALALYELRNGLFLENGTESFEQYYNQLISNVGLDSQKASFNVENQYLIVNQLENQRQSVMGVSIDEEMVNLIKTQTAFQAAAKVITIADELMQTVLNSF